MRRGLETTALSVALAVMATGCVGTRGESKDDVYPPGSEAAEGDIGASAQALSELWAQVQWTDGDGLNVRSGPYTSSPVVHWLPEGTWVRITCQTTGTTIGTSNVWNYLPDYGGYVTDWYMETGYSSWIPGMANCDSGGGGGGSMAAMRAAAVAEARAHIGYMEYSGNCNMFSSALGSVPSCPEWCSDFVRYVWDRAGFDIGGTTYYSGTFYDYGQNHGTWKWAGAVPEVADAVLWCATDMSWCAHIGMVTEVSGSSFRVIHGNFHYPTSTGQVYESGFINRWEDVGTGYYVAGFASPVPR